MCLAVLWKSFALCHVVSMSCTGPLSPQRSRCWEAAGLGQGFGCTPCTSSVFLAPAPPDCGPAHTIVKNKNPGGAPARGTQLPCSPGQGRLAALGGGVCSWGAGERTQQWWLSLAQPSTLERAAAGGRGLLWHCILSQHPWAPVVESTSSSVSSVISVPSTEGNKRVLLFIIILLVNTVFLKQMTRSAPSLLSLGLQRGSAQHSIGIAKGTCTQTAPPPPSRLLGRGQPARAAYPEPGEEETMG